MTPLSALLTFLQDELAPAPGRLGRTLRMTALTVLVVVASETFRIPLAAYSAYIVFFASREEAASTVQTGILLIAAATVAVFATLLVYTLSAGEPALRLPLMAGVAFAGVYLSRISPLGPIAFAIGFVMTVALTLIDIQPRTAPLPPTEILTQTVLWLWVVAVLPLGLVVLGDLLTGRDPDDVFRLSLANRLNACADVWQRGRTDTTVCQRLQAHLRAGLTGPLQLLHSAARHHRYSIATHAAHQALLARTYELMLFAQEWPAVATATDDARARQLAEALHGQSARMLGADIPPSEPIPQMPAPPATMADLLLARSEAAVAMLPARIDETTRDERAPAHPAFIATDAFSNPQHVRFALKVTLSVMLAYISYELLAWPEIRTAMITCFFVTFGTMGETVHRMALRLGGALLGGVLGLGVVIFVMPWLDSMADLALLVGIFAFIAAWVATSSDRLAYAGMQMALAFFLCILVGTGPHIELAVARDRLVGVLLGNLIVWVVFAHVWPESIRQHASVALSRAVTMLADLLRNSGQERDRALLAFDTALTCARRFLALGRLERLGADAPQSDARLGDAAEAALRPLLILDTPESSATEHACRTSLAAWLDPAASMNTDPWRSTQDEHTVRAAWLLELKQRCAALHALLRGTPEARS